MHGTWFPILMLGLLVLGCGTSGPGEPWDASSRERNQSTEDESAASERAESPSLPSATRVLVQLADQLGIEPRRSTSGSLGSRARLRDAIRPWYRSPGREVVLRIESWKIGVCAASVTPQGATVLARGPGAPPPAPGAKTSASALVIWALRE